ncbi:MAG: glycosyltransferase family 2 protein, partial [Bacteroidales bacterium]|nr:glycosyltransferase family 2 protein [Bacteroidales bacterium]
MISVIVCTYNRDKYLYKVLSHIASNDYPADDYEIVLVNNNSTDNTLAEAERFKLVYPNINITIVTEQQNGLSFARNRGIVETKGDWLVFLDDDAMIETDYIANLQKHLFEHSKAGAFGGQI